MAIKDQTGSTEIINCPRCGKEKYVYFNSIDEVVNESKCNCKVKRIKGMKPLDYAFKKISKEVLKWKEK
jgi:hypothetical protein